MKFMTQGLSEQYLKQVHEESLYVLAVQQQKLAGAGSSGAAKSAVPAAGGNGGRPGQILN